jgi:hypothetical protein
VNFLCTCCKPDRLITTAFILSKAADVQREVDASCCNVGLLFLWSRDQDPSVCASPIRNGRPHAVRSILLVIGSHCICVHLRATRHDCQRNETPLRLGVISKIIRVVWLLHLRTTHSSNSFIFFFCLVLLIESILSFHKYFQFFKLFTVLSV